MDASSRPTTCVAAPGPTRSPACGNAAGSSPPAMGTPSRTLASRPSGRHQLAPPGDLQPLECIPVRPGTKLAALVVALRRPQGATNLQLTLATGWQPHSVRGAISGLLRRRLGLTVTQARNADGERVYRGV